MPAEEKFLPNILKDFAEEVKILLYMAFAFLNIDVDIAKIIFYLMMIDTFSGYIKCMVIKDMSFSFRTLYIGLLSKVVILLIPMTLALMGIGLGYDFTPVMDAVLRLVILSEGISIMTNVLSIRDKKTYENKDYLAILVRFIRDKFTELIDKTKNSRK